MSLCGNGTSGCVSDVSEVRFAFCFPVSCTFRHVNFQDVNILAKILYDTTKGRHISLLVSGAMNPSYATGAHGQVHKAENGFNYLLYYK